MIFIQLSSISKFWSGKNIATLVRTTLNLSRKAFTQSPPLSNNHKILINYLIFYRIYPVEWTKCINTKCINTNEWCLFEIDWWHQLMAKNCACFGSRCKVNNGWIQTSSICPTSSECANFVLLYIFRMFQVLNKGGKFLQERERTNAMQCIAIACQWRPNEGREGISYESPRNQFNHVAAHYRKLFTVAINDKCAFIPCLGPAANQIMAILDKLNCRQAICQSANILQV